MVDGDVCRGLVVPIYMVLPRLLTCPTLAAGYVIYCICFKNNFRKGGAVAICSYWSGNFR